LLAEENGVKSTIPDKPIDLKNYTKLCDLRRKFQVLYKVEFQVSSNIVPPLVPNLTLSIEPEFPEFR
jgi:hypothetical protein